LARASGVAGSPQRAGGFAELCRAANRGEAERAVALIGEITRGKTFIMVEHDYECGLWPRGDRDRFGLCQIIASDAPNKIRSNSDVQEA